MGPKRAGSAIVRLTGAQFWAPSLGGDGQMLVCSEVSHYSIRVINPICIGRQRSRPTSLATSISFNSLTVLRLRYRYYQPFFFVILQPSLLSLSYPTYQCTRLQTTPV